MTKILCPIIDPAFPNIEAFDVNHLPIVKHYADRIGLVDTINHLVPSKMDVDPGTVILAMVYDTLSGRSPLYRLESFYETQDIELLISKDCNSEKFNDDNVGRVLEKCFEVGTIKIFNMIALNALEAFDVSLDEKRHVHLDTTSKNVYGDYDWVDPPFLMTFGHSKDHRPDLKQFMISMFCVGGNIPIFGKTEDGNASDKKINNSILSQISNRMAQHGLAKGAFIYIADSALFSPENFSRIEKDDILFISRLPATYNECNRVIKEAIIKNQWEDLGILAHTKPTAKRPAALYKTYETKVNLYGNDYRAIVVHSSSHDKRRKKRIERQLKEDRQILENTLKEAKKTKFFCKPDAELAEKKLKKIKSEYHEFDITIEEQKIYAKGRPQKNGIRKLKEIRYSIVGGVEEKKDEVEKLKQETGCFVIVTNVPEDFEDGYDSKRILQTYKEQHGIEQNFGFLKDPVIVNALFLKKAERIEALGMVLLISLLIWRLIERSMRNYVKNTGNALVGWDNKPTKKPTSFMMSKKFMGLKIIKFENKRFFPKPLSSVQNQYLEALGVPLENFIEPRAG